VLAGRLILPGHGYTPAAGYPALSLANGTVLRAQPAVLSAEDLLEQVWDEHTDPFSNVVSVTVSRLRRKLGDPPVIQTITNVGYRITGGTP